MIYWIPIYVHSGRSLKKSADRMNGEQLAEMDYIFRSACQGLDSPDIRRIYEQHKKKNLFYHINENTGMRYHFEINRKKGTVTILSVDADNKKLACVNKNVNQNANQASCREAAAQTTAKNSQSKALPAS